MTPIIFELIVCFKGVMSHMFPGTKFAFLNFTGIFYMFCPEERDKMEKIVVLKGSSGDDNLIDCLRMLFPECVVEVHERRPVKRINNTLVYDNFNNPNANDERLEEYLSFL